MRRLFQRVNGDRCFLILSLAFCAAGSVVLVPDVRADDQLESSSLFQRLLKNLLPADGEDVEDAAGGTPEALDEGAGLVLQPADLLSEEDLRKARPWRAPDYSAQWEALGWKEDAFTVHPKMKDRVAFWKDVYSRYSTNQGLLHDTKYLHVVYEAVDFSSIMNDESLSKTRKQRAREALVDERRRLINERLRSLHGRASSEGLAGDELRIWKMFESVSDPNKFLEASERGRVRFQLGQRDKFILGIYYSGRYLEEMERIFREEGLPIELTRLPFVESSFNVNARSRVGASGVWQFMPRTARPLMKVNKDVDERNDPLRSTKASAVVLRQNYQMLRAWPLAITGYNHGPYGVRKIVNQLGTNEIAEIIGNYSSRTFGFASENFYACFLAALQVEKEARRFFGDVKWSRPLQMGEVKTVRPMAYRHLLEFFDGDGDMASSANPHLANRVRQGRSLIPRGTFVRVPTTRERIADSFLRGRISPAKLSASLRASPIPSETQSDTVAAMDEPSAPPPLPESSVEERLEQVSETAAVVLPAVTGERLKPRPSLARELPMRPPLVSAHQEASVSEAVPRPPQEDEGDASSHETGQGVLAGMDGEEVVAEPKRKPEPEPEPEPKRKPEPKPESARKHRVKRGESLIAIARTYNVPLSELLRANGLEKSSPKKRDHIKTGAELLIPNPKEDGE